MMQPLPETLRVQLHPARSAPFFCWMPGPHQTACVIDIGLTGCQVSKKWIQVPFVYDASVGELLCVRLAAARPFSFAGGLEAQFCLATVVHSSSVLELPHVQLASCFYQPVGCLKYKQPFSAVSSAELVLPSCGVNPLRGGAL